MMKRRRYQSDGVMAVLGGMVLVGVVGVVGNVAMAAESRPVGFNDDVRPILSNKCFTCHGPDAAAREADLRLDVRSSALSVIQPGKPGASELMKRLHAADDDVMPPVKTEKIVTEAERAILRRWIEEGAEYEGHWSFVSVEKPIEPEVDSDGVANGIDRFVIARLKREGMAPSAMADRATLLRRVTLDLTGLAPTRAEIRTFLDDARPDDQAYEALVDRLLASPRYGEHMAYAWLDAARYADSDGYESDPMRTMWPWRDWVVKAFNDNQRYDDFIVEQLAGDLLEDPSLSQRLATGFNRNHRLNNEGGILAEEWRVENVVDRAETTAAVFMGLTWGCARCHDHKYDPITQADYYRLYAYFNNIPETGIGRGTNAAPSMLVSAVEHLDEYKQVLDELAPWQAKFDARKKAKDFNRDYNAWIETDAETRKPALLASLAKITKKKWEAKHTTQAKQYYLVRADAAGKKLNQVAGPLLKKKVELEKTGASVLVMEEREEVRKTHVLERGAFDQPRAEVRAGMPEFLGAMDEDLPRNRLGLAKWLVDPKHPLTARVAVNRFWERYFGMGLVKTQEDFGAQGESPSHRALLDHLAWRFVESGWDVKGLQKYVVMSRTYRQRSVVTAAMVERDPENRLLGRGPRYRLGAAVIRDQTLYAAGLMVEQHGGAPVKPYQPEGLWKDIIKGGPTYVRDKGAKLYRRSLYTLWRRAVKPPLMMLLDSNERDTCRVSQRRTNTPLQALLLLNDVTFVEAARGLGVRMMGADGDRGGGGVRFGMEVAVGRAPTEVEREILMGELEAFRAIYREDESAARALIETGESKVDDDLDVSELAAFTALGRVLLNLDETITKQ